MRYATPLLILLLLAGCVSSEGVLAPGVEVTIPDGASAVRLSYDRPPDATYRSLYRHLAREGYGFATSDSEMRTLTTDYRQVGSGTTLSVTVYVEEREGGSLAVLRGQWGLTSGRAAFTEAMSGLDTDTEQGDPALWGESPRSDFAFAQLVKITGDLNFGARSYEIADQ